jgi:uncharacterized protein YggE
MGGHADGGTPVGITAFGAASVKAVPDLVRVRFKIVRVEQAPAAAFEAARGAVRAVRGTLREHGVGDAAVEGSRLDLKTATEFVDGTHFDVIAKRELRAEARRKAVAAARAKADLYAEAAGVRVGAVLHIEDVDPEQPGASRYRSHAEAAAPTNPATPMTQAMTCPRTAAPMPSTTMPGRAVRPFDRGGSGTVHCGRNCDVRRPQDRGSQRLGTWPGA